MNGEGDFTVLVSYRERSPSARRFLPAARPISRQASGAYDSLQIPAGALENYAKMMQANSVMEEPAEMM